MTRDELEDFLKGSIVPKLEQAWLDLESSRVREEERSQDLERERDARKKAEKAAADKDAEIEVLKKALADARDTKATDNRNRFGSPSRKMRHSVDKDFNKDRTDRREEKESHDGTAAQTCSATDSVDIASEYGKVMTERELLARQTRNGTHYRLSDASEKVMYPCDIHGIPEGWEVIEGEDTVTRILFDTRKTVIARVIEFVKVRRLVKYTLEDGTEAEKWEYESFHVPCRGWSTGIVHITCAAHVWRYIMDWYNATKDERARRLLTEISALYTVKASLKGKTPDEILERRGSVEVTEILTRYRALLDTLDLIKDTLPAIGQKAVRYAFTQYPKMSRWREDPDFEIDNNFAERSARPVALERKNRLHHASHKGAEASCVIRSVVETYRMWGKSVRDFFLCYFSALVSGRPDYDALMPWATTAPC